MCKQIKCIQQYARICFQFDKIIRQARFDQHQYMERSQLRLNYSIQFQINKLNNIEYICLLIMHISLKNLTNPSTGPKDQQQCKKTSQFISQRQQKSQNERQMKSTLFTRINKFNNQRTNVLQRQYKTLILFVIQSTMAFLSNPTSHQYALNLRNESYNPSKLLNPHHHSDKCIPTNHMYGHETKRQNIEEPFYLKLSNSHKNIIQNRIKPKPELQNIQMMKKILDHHYSSEISLKHEQKRLLQRKKIMEEKDYLSHFEKHSVFEKKQLNKQKSDYNKDLHEQMNKKKYLLESIKTEERQTDMNRKPRQNSLIHKAQSFRKFYEQAYRYRENVANQYNEYMKEEKKYQQARNKSELLNLRSDRKDYSKHRQFEKHMKQHQTSSLKQILQKQIHDKVGVHQLKDSDPISAKSKNQVYNPIVNPIDYRMDLSNKYIQKQISPMKKFFL